MIQLWGTAHYNIILILLTLSFVSAPPESTTNFDLCDDEYVHFGALSRHLSTTAN